MPEMRKLNYLSNDVKINPDLIPNLIPISVLQEWQSGDTEPYYKIQEIEYPIEANGINYLESFFKTFISKLNKRPIPGSKDGHDITWGKRPATDFIMVGGKLDSKGDGTGKVYFKNYIPPEGANGSNEIFIRENKSDMVHYSLVSYTKDETYTDDDGNFIINVIESIKGERNDAVEYGMGAMKQKTNEDKNYISFEAATGEKENKTIIREASMTTKKEVLDKLITLKANAEITLPEIAKALNLENLLLTEDHRNAIEVINELKKNGITDPVADLSNLKKQIKENANSVRNAELDSLFGNNADGKNYLRQYAGVMCENLTGEDFKNKINELKEDPIALKLAADRADYNSETNTIGIIENKNDKAENTSRRVDKY